MPDDPPRGGRTVDADDPASDARSATSGGDPTSSASIDNSDSVDDAVKRRLREAYLNDAEGVLIVTAVRAEDDEVVVELRPPHGGVDHVERFPAPRHGSLSESEAFLEFLSAAGVSPLDVDEIVGKAIPATYDPETGWRIDPEYVAGSAAESAARGPVDRSVSWVREHRYWLLAGGFVLGELLFAAVIILLFI